MLTEFPFLIWLMAEAAHAVFLLDRISAIRDTFLNISARIAADKAVSFLDHVVGGNPMTHFWKIVKKHQFFRDITLTAAYKL